MALGTLKEKRKRRYIESISNEMVSGVQLNDVRQKLHNKLTNHDKHRQPSEPITTWSQKIRSAGTKRGKMLTSQCKQCNSWLRLYFLLAGNGCGNFQPINDVKERLGLSHDASTQTHLSWMDFLTITKYDLISLPARKGEENEWECIFTEVKRRKKQNKKNIKLKIVSRHWIKATKESSNRRLIHQDSISGPQVWSPRTIQLSNMSTRSGDPMTGINEACGDLYVFHVTVN